jgi:hypothetical protein
MSLGKAKPTQSPFHCLTHSNRRRQYFIGAILRMLLQRHSQSGGPMKTYFGINVDDDHTCLDRLPEVFVAGPEADAAQCRFKAD